MLAPPGRWGQCAAEAFAPSVERIASGVEVPQQPALTCWSLTHGLSMLLVDRQLEFHGFGLDQAPELARAVIAQFAQGLTIQ